MYSMYYYLHNHRVFLYKILLGDLRSGNYPRSDSRLHRKIAAGTLGGHDLPYLLCSRSERGRNYARVFQDLLAELEHDTGHRRREVALTIVTHAQCHIPRPTVEALARRASLYGVFVLPSQPLNLDYLPLLSGHQIITAESIAEPTERRRRALDVVSDVVAATRRG